ncbi:DUF86 domain-containing protein [Mechercharimyces sp. CAU 1602]|nr:DUF86 domain-containing protein [Mechercharimyces sp. CAU 1602]
MMYEVDTTRINAQCDILQTALTVMEEVKENGNRDLMEQFAVARAIHLAVESVIDVGNSLIDGFIMRDPGGYLDIIDILEDERVIPVESVAELKALVYFRERLVRYYHEMKADEVWEWLNRTDVLSSYRGWIQSYLAKELEKEAL